MVVLSKRQYEKRKKKKVAMLYSQRNFTGKPGKHFAPVENRCKCSIILHIYFGGVLNAKDARDWIVDILYSFSA